MEGRRIFAIAFTISLLLNGVTIYWLAIAVNHNTQLSNQVRELVERNENLSATILSLSQEIENLRDQLEYYRSQLNYFYSAAGRAGLNSTLFGESIINLVAVREVYSDIFNVYYEGVLLECIIELRPGEGRVLVNTEPRIGIDLQTSVQTAVRVTEKLTGVSLSSIDVIVTVRAGEEVQVVDGPSAGAAIAIAIMAAIRGDSLSRSVFITGTILQDGSIGKVGGIVEKAEAAAKSGGSIFLVPKGQRNIIVYEKCERKIAPGVAIIEYKPVQMDLQEYLSEKGYETLVYEVANVTEAYQYFLPKRA